MKSWMMVRMGGVRHDPQRFMGKIVTMLHFNRDAVEFASHERDLKIKPGDQNTASFSEKHYGRERFWRIFKIS